MDYILKIKNVKRITLKINEEGCLIVTAPQNISKEYINELIQKNQDKINNKLKEVAKRIYEKNKYFYLLGEKFIIEHEDIKNYRIDYKKKILYINTKYKDEILPLLYKRFAKDLLPKMTIEIAHKNSFTVNRITVKDMKTRWGSCNHKKAYINLNSNLIKYSKDAIVYVIIHELCHLVHPNHSKNFYVEVSKYCPNYKKISLELTKVL